MKGESLVVVLPRGEGDRTLTVGRSVTADVPLTNPAAFMISSRLHAHLEAPAAAPSSGSVGDVGGIVAGAGGGGGGGGGDSDGFPAGATYLRDSGSQNGTFVDGVRLEKGARVRLQAGQAVSFGDPVSKAPSVIFTVELVAIPQAEQVGWMRVRVEEGLGLFECRSVDLSVR